MGNVVSKYTVKFSVPDINPLHKGYSPIKIGRITPPIFIGSRIHNQEKFDQTFSLYKQLQTETECNCSLCKAAFQKFKTQFVNACALLEFS